MWDKRDQSASSRILGQIKLCRRETDLTGSKGLASGSGRLLYILMISRMLEVGSGLGLARGAGVGVSFGGSAFARGGV